MFISPYFGGCKYTNYFLFINKNIEFQRLVLLITSSLQDFFRQKEQQKPKPAAADRHRQFCTVYSEAQAVSSVRLSVRHRLFRTVYPAAPSVRHMAISGTDATQNCSQ